MYTVVSKSPVYQSNTFFKIFLRKNFHNTKVTIKQNGGNIFEETFSKFDWKTNKTTKILLNLNELRVPLIQQTLLQDKHLSLPSKPLNGFKIADIGCGAGLLCEPLARLGANVVGLDTSPSLIKMAQDNLEKFQPDLKPNLNFFASSVQDFINEKTRESFHAVVLSEVLEHVDNVDSFLKDCFQLIKSEGNIIITTINQTLLAQLVVITLAENILNLIPKKTHDYKMFIPPNSLKLLLEKSKLKQNKKK